MNVGEDERLERLIKFSFFGFQNTDLHNLLCNSESGKKAFLNLQNFLDSATHATSACFLGFLSCQDERYLMYAYQYNNLEYGFAWETFYDESHRDPSLLAEPPWFDFVYQGQMFKIKLNPKKPEEHYVIERPFREIKDMVIRLGTNPCL